LADLPYLNHTDKLVQEKYQIFIELMREQPVSIVSSMLGFSHPEAAISVKDFYLPDDV
jgi:hypothetical protein